MSRPRSSAIRPDRRVRLRVDLPREVLAAAEEIVKATGLDREVVLGDLAAAALPGLLAQAADRVVGQPARARLFPVIPKDERPEALNLRAAQHHRLTTDDDQAIAT